jgi:hypothetical protein
MLTLYTLILQVSAIVALAVVTIFLVINGAGTGEILPVSMAIAGISGYHAYNNQKNVNVNGSAAAAGKLN